MRASKSFFKVPPQDSTVLRMDPLLLLFGYRRRGSSLQKSLLTKGSQMDSLTWSDDSNGSQMFARMSSGVAFNLMCMRPLAFLYASSCLDAWSRCRLCLLMMLSSFSPTFAQTASSRGSSFETARKNGPQVRLGLVRDMRRPLRAHGLRPRPYGLRRSMPDCRPRPRHPAASSSVKSAPRGTAPPAAGGPVSMTAITKRARSR